MAFALPIAATALGVGTSAAAAISQNRAISDSGRSLNKAELIQRQQYVNSAAQEKDKRLREARRVEGRIRAAAGATGRGVDGNFAALVRANTFETNTDVNIIDRNLANSLLGQRSQFEAERTRLGASIESPVLAAFTGGLQGASTGLSIGRVLRTTNDTV